MQHKLQRACVSCLTAGVVKQSSESYWKQRVPREINKRAYKSAFKYNNQSGTDNQSGITDNKSGGSKVWARFRGRRVQSPERRESGCHTTPLNHPFSTRGGFQAQEDVLACRVPKLEECTIAGRKLLHISDLFSTPDETHDYIARGYCT